MAMLPTLYTTLYYTTNFLKLCESFWMATQWSECSSKCAGVEGVKTRSVFCAAVGDANDTFAKIEDEKCDEKLK